MSPISSFPSPVENRDDFPYSYRAVPVWRNWQTRGTQNPVSGNRSVGSIPSTGTSEINGLGPAKGPHLWTEQGSQKEPKTAAFSHQHESSCYRYREKRSE
jgi:hypothetical protein